MTKITIEAGALAKALRDVAPIAKNMDLGSIIMSNVLIEIVGKDQLKLTTSNTEQRISRIVPTVKITGKGSACVDAARFSALASALDSGSQVELTLGEAQLGIASGRAKFRLNMLPAADFPPLPKPADMTILSLGDEFIRALDTCRHAVTTSEVQWHLRGIQIRADGPVSAADGLRMARTNFGPFEGEFPNTTIPTETVDLLLRLASDSDKAITVEIGGGKIWFDLGDTILASKVIDGEFPNLDAIVPPDDAITTFVRVDREHLLAAINRIVVLVEGKDRIMKFEAGDNKLTISNTSHGDQGTEEIDCETTGDSVRRGGRMNSIPILSQETMRTMMQARIIRAAPDIWPQPGHRTIAQVDAGKTRPYWKGR